MGGICLVAARRGGMGRVKSWIIDRWDVLGGVLEERRGEERRRQNKGRGKQALRQMVRFFRMDGWMDGCMLKQSIDLLPMSYLSFI